MKSSQGKLADHIAELNLHTIQPTTSHWENLSNLFKFCGQKKLKISFKKSNKFTVSRRLLETLDVYICVGINIKKIHVSKTLIHRAHNRDSFS